MKLNKKQQKVIRWSARLLALAILIFALPFYFGYGNPLPFTNPDYTLFDNIWLSAFPLIFIGLALGWKYEKLGGYLIVALTMIGFLFGILTLTGFPTPMLAPLIPGGMYLLLAYSEK